MQARSFSHLVQLAAFAALLLLMFLPMIAIQGYESAAKALRPPAAGEVTVGIAVILRATARRLLRGASSNFLRTTFGALGRASARALTRRFVKFSGRVFFGSVIRTAAGPSSEGTEEAADGEASGWRMKSRTSIVSLAIGGVALCASFLGVLQVTAPEVAEGITSGGAVSRPAAIGLAGLPLLVYALLHRAIGWRVGVTACYRTEIDGLLLQAYFTGAGSFLPMTTDVEYRGNARGQVRVAAGSIGGMFCAHLVLSWIGRWAHAPHLSFLGSMFLIYAFVYAFPIKPLEGHVVWSSSRRLWVLLALPILVSFLFTLPAEFGEIL